MKLFQAAKLNSKPFWGIHTLRMDLLNPVVVRYRKTGRIRTLSILGIVRVMWVVTRKGMA